MSKLDNLIYSHPRYSDLIDPKEKQVVLDEITPEILADCTAKDICDHTKEVYNTTVQEYAAEAHNQGIILDLVLFMRMIQSGSRVLDVGCGLGRDALFMRYTDPNFRRDQMNRPMRGKTVYESSGGIPKNSFKVVAIDGSIKMLTMAKQREKELITKFGLAEPVCFMFEDMHQLRSASFADKFHGIWCCTSLLTHTPRELVESSISSLSNLLVPGGIVFFSYTNGLATGKYDKLKLSSTGRIKYFSQPNPYSIMEIAEKNGLELLQEYFSDFEVGGVVKQKDLFVSQFFRKV